MKHSTDIKTKKTVIAVDFDGVIHRYSKGWLDGSCYDLPIKGSKKALKLLVEYNFEIVIFTTRLNPLVNLDVDAQQREIENWLEKYKFKKNIHYHSITGCKPLATVYIDDKGLRFLDWETTITFLLLQNQNDTKF